MGLDACMYAQPRRTITDAELRQLAYKFAVLFPDFASVTRPESVYEGQRALSWGADGVIVVNTFRRYYGPGYERGPALDIIAAARWLEDTVGPVYYGSDSDSCNEDSGLPRFGPDEWEAMWQHYVGDHGNSYYLDRGGKRYICDFCEGPTVDYSYCGGQVTSRCPACKHEHTRQRTSGE